MFHARCEGLLESVQMSLGMMNIKILAVALTSFLVANSFPTEQGPCVNCGPVADRLTEEKVNSMDEKLQLKLLEIELCRK